MFIDANTMVCSAQQVTADAVSEDSIDLGALTIQRDIAPGEPMGYCIVIKAVGTTSGSSLIQAIMSAAVGLGTPTVIGQLNLVTADLAVGKRHILPIGQGSTVLRYHGLNFDITGTVDFTVDAWLAPLSMISKEPRAYRRGYTVD